MYSGINYCLKCGGKLSIKNDRENKSRPICNDCGWIYYKNPIPASACLVVNSKNEILLIKRKFEPSSGKWALPSGYIEINQTPEQAAIAEMKEETNLDGEIDYFIDYFTGDSPIYQKIISFGYKMNIIGGTLEAGDDASEAKFVSYENLPEICFASHRHFIEISKKNK